MNIGPKSDNKKGNKGKSYGSGKETLRFRSNAPAQIEQAVRNFSILLFLEGILNVVYKSVGNEHNIFLA